MVSTILRGAAASLRWLDVIEYVAKILSFVAELLKKSDDKS